MNTRFSPEASWNLHIGHLKIIFRNLELSKINNGKINLRIDDTNPKKNKKKYKKRIVKEIKKINRINENLFNKNIFYTSNYFYKLFQYLEEINKKNLKKIKKISEGWYKEKKKIINIFKNKISYRIIYKKHYRVGWNWFLYGTYDYTHCISDKIENIYYSICSEEFKKNIHIYNLIINILYKNFKPKQKEVRKLKIKNNILSKSKLKKLIKKKFIKNSNDKKLLIIKNIKIKEFKILKILLKNINKKYKKYIFNKNINLKIENLNEKKIVIKKNFIINKKIIIKNLFFIKKNKKIKIINLKKNISLKNTNYLINCFKIINKKNIKCKLFKKKNKLKNIKWNNELNLKIKFNINKNIKNKDLTINQKMENIIIKNKNLNINKKNIKMVKIIKNNKNFSALYDLNV